MPNSDGSITFSTELDNKKLEKDLDGLRKKIQTLEDKVTVKSSTLSSMEKEAAQLGVALDSAKAKLAEMQNSQSWTSKTQIKAQEQEVMSLQKDWDKAQNSVERMRKSIEEINSQAGLLRKRAGDASTQLAQISVDSNAVGSATDRASGYLDKLIDRLKKLAVNAFAFTLISKALRSLRAWLWETIKTNDSAMSSVAKLKGALLTLVQPLVNVIIPAFTAFVNVLTDIVTAIAGIVSMVFGTTIEESANAAESLNDQKNALLGVGSAAKKAGKDLASFDEINRASSDDSAGGGGDSSGIKPDFSFIDSYKDKINELETIISGALLVLGVILTFSGVNIPLGLGLIAAGARGLAGALSEEWGKVPKRVQDIISALLITLGTVAAVFGVIFLLTGHVGIGLGLIALGASALWAADVLGVDWQTVPALIRENIDIILLALAGVSLVFGVIFLLTGHVGLGLGLIAVSALMFWGADEMGFDWEAIPPEVSVVVGAILSALAGVAIAFGVVFLFTGNIGIGLGLIAAGALAFWGAKEMGFDWDSIPPEVKSVISTTLLALAGAAVIIGTIFLFTGHAGLGLGLIAVGALAFWGANKLSFNWNSIPPKVKDTITDILSGIASAAVVFGAVFLFTGHIMIGLGLLAVGVLAFFGASKTAEDWGLVCKKIQDELTIMLGILAGASLVFGTIFLLTGNIPLGLALIGLSVASFFGLTVTGSDEKWGEITNKVGEGLDNVESEIESHTDSIKTQSGEVGNSMVYGAAEAVEAGAPVVSDAMSNTLESGMVAAKNAVNDQKENVVGAYKSVFNAILTNTELFANRYLSTLHSMLQQTAMMLSALPDSPKINIPVFSTISIPRLAQGAVIPPNREFLAVLGDQKSGTNIEAPLETIKQALSEVIAQSGYNGSAAQLKITLEVDKREFGRAVVDLGDKERSRRGVRIQQRGALT